VDPALLEPGVVVGGDRRELCDLFAAKASDPPLGPTLGQVDGGVPLMVEKRAGAGSR
jgi:hypothetical protein